MKAADRLAKQLGANIDESMGATRAGGSSPPVVHGGPGAFPGLGTSGGSDKFQGASRIKDALAIEVDRIIPDPDQPRKEFDPESLDALAASLKDRGQLQPIRVRWSEASGRWVIVSGERRWRAARMVGLVTIACVEAKGDPTPAEILEDQIVENCIREDLKPIEQARAFRSLLDIRGCSARQLAESLRISHQAIGRALSLLTLPPELQDQVDAGIVPASAASEVAKVEDDDVKRQIADRVAAGKMTRDEVVEAVRQSRPKPGRIEKGRGASQPKAPKLPTERTHRVDQFKVVVTSRKGFDEWAMIEVLEKTVEQLKARIASAEDRSQSAA